MNNQELNLEDLRAEADELGMDYAKTLGAVKLSEKLEKFKEEKKEEKSPKVKKLSKAEVSKMKANSISKVIISNLDQTNTGASTVYACVENEYISIARVLPLDVEIYVEAALIECIKDMKTVSHRPKKEASGRLGTVATPTETPMYAVSKVD